MDLRDNNPQKKWKNREFTASFEFALTGIITAFKEERNMRKQDVYKRQPSFRYHDLPYQECLAKVGTVSLQDYRDDLVALIESLDQPPLILGHSLGCLVARCV